MDRIKEIGYAKVNLHLDITGRTDDGYHTVQTVMQSISLCDEVMLTRRADGEIVITCNVPGVPTDQSNLAYRAADLLRTRLGERGGFDIHIEKHIPMAAGMAGGSADAAAVLRGVNRLYAEALTVDELCAVAAGLGADVPFCVMGGTAYADGRGDVLHPFAQMPACAIVAACGGQGVSTPWAYRCLDERYQNFDGTAYTPVGTERLAAAMRSGELAQIARCLYNIFEEPILSERPVADEIRRSMRELGALGAMMSGSGPSVFGLFGDDESAKTAAEALCARGVFATACRTVSPCLVP